MVRRPAPAADCGCLRRRTKVAAMHDERDEAERSTAQRLRSVQEAAGLVVEMLRELAAPVAPPDGASDRRAPRPVAGLARAVDRSARGAIRLTSREMGNAARLGAPVSDAVRRDGSQLVRALTRRAARDLPDGIRAVGRDVDLQACLLAVLDVLDLDRLIA